MSSKVFFPTGWQQWSRKKTCSNQFWGPTEELDSFRRTHSRSHVRQVFFLIQNFYKFMQIRNWFSAHNSIKDNCDSSQGKLIYAAVRNNQKTSIHKTIKTYFLQHVHCKLPPSLYSETRTDKAITISSLAVSAG